VTKQSLQRIVPIVISIVLLIILASYAPWGKVGHVLADLDFSTIIILLVLSLLYYSLKALRSWYLLQAMGIQQPFKLVALSYIAAQPVSLLPAGEAYRSQTLHRITGVPVQRSLPQFTMQGFLEAAAMVSIMIVSTLALNTLRLPAIILGILVLIFAIAISRGYVANVTRLVNRLPFLHLSERDIQGFNQRHEAVLSWQWLPFLYGLSLVAELVGTAIAFTSVVGLGGHLSIYQSCLFYVIPVIVGFVSLLPGGIGISEQSAIGVLLLSHIHIATAVAATVVMRVTIVGLGVLYGVIALLIEKFRVPRSAEWLREHQPS
jgi:uncharacterized protein (TIRG00374 family)